jgi:hypothetical protein
MKITLGITLPPGPIEPATFTNLLETAIGPHGWIRPMSYGSLEPDETLLLTSMDPVAAIEACLLEDGSVSIADSTGLGHVNVAADRYHLSYGGMVHVVGDWVHFVSRLGGKVSAVAETMALLRSPFAFAGASGAVIAHGDRWVSDEHGGHTVVNVRGAYSCGLDFPHWRMWFGVEWTDFLGRELLRQAPAYESRPEGAGWFVQIHETPDEWDDDSAIEAATRFAAGVGKNIFYDPSRPDLPLEAPDFSHLMRAAKARYPHLRERRLGRPPGR